MEYSGYTIKIDPETGFTHMFLEDKKGEIIGKKIYHSNNTMISEETFFDGLLHSYDSQPSKVTYRSNGTIYSKEWHMIGILVGKREIYDSTGKEIIGLFTYEDGNLIMAESFYKGKHNTIQGNQITFEEKWYPRNIRELSKIA